MREGRFSLLVFNVNIEDVDLRAIADGRKSGWRVLLALQPFHVEQE
jgi:hypothetical protein